jgi:hypothetical protein
MKQMIARMHWVCEIRRQSPEVRSWNIFDQLLLSFLSSNTSIFEKSSRMFVFQEVEAMRYTWCRYVSRAFAFFVPVPLSFVICDIAAAKCNCRGIVFVTKSTRGSFWVLSELHFSF